MQNITKHIPLTKGFRNQIQKNRQDGGVGGSFSAFSPNQANQLQGAIDQSRKSAINFITANDIAREKLSNVLQQRRPTVATTARKSFTAGTNQGH